MIRKSFYIGEEDNKELENKISQQGFKGKGRLERFMETISRNTILILKGDNAKVTIEYQKNKRS